MLFVALICLSYLGIGFLLFTFVFKSKSKIKASEVIDRSVNNEFEKLNTDLKHSIDLMNELRQKELESQKFEVTKAVQCPACKQTFKLNIKNNSYIVTRCSACNTRLSFSMLNGVFSNESEKELKGYFSLNVIDKQATL